MTMLKNFLPNLYCILFYTINVNASPEGIGLLPDISSGVRLTSCLLDSFLELTFVLTFINPHGMLGLFPVGELQGSEDTLAPGERPRIGNPKGDLMKPMKKPIRLLGMVFQIDK